MTQNMKNSFTRLSNDVLVKDVLKCQFLNFRPKSKWKKTEITLEKGFIFVPCKFFSKMLD